MKLSKPRDWFRRSPSNYPGFIQTSYNVWTPRLDTLRRYWQGRVSVHTMIGDQRHALRLEIDLHHPTMVHTMKDGREQDIRDLKFGPGSKGLAYDRAAIEAEDEKRREEAIDVLLQKGYARPDAAKLLEAVGWRP